MTRRILSREPSETETQRFAELFEEGFSARVREPTKADAAKDKKRYAVSWSNHLNSEANAIKIEIESLVRRGPPATRYLKAEWRKRAEDAVWALINAPEMILIP